MWIGAKAAWGMGVVNGYLLCRNADLVLHRRPQRLSIRSRSLQYSISVTVLGLGAALSALALQGRLYLPFWAAFLLMVAAALILLRLITLALKASSASP